MAVNDSVEIQCHPVLLPPVHDVRNLVGHLQHRVPDLKQGRRQASPEDAG
jgi:hypothetical protein